MHKKRQLLLEELLITVKNQPVSSSFMFRNETYADSTSSINSSAIMSIAPYNVTHNLHVIESEV